MAGYIYNSTAAIHRYLSVQSLYGFDLYSIQLTNDSKVKSPAAEEWLDCMVAVHNQIYNTHKHQQICQGQPVWFCPILDCPGPGGPGIFKCDPR